MRVTESADIIGALGTIRRDERATRPGWWPRVRTLLAILGPGLIVMVGDNDAGAFGTYAQAGQNYGTTLLWTLLLLVPVLYVNQEMVLRLGMIARVGHARLILQRFGAFWGAFSVIDLFVLNALTLVTEFIGVSLAMDFLGLPKLAGVGLAALAVVAAAGTGSFRRFERFSLILCAGSLLLLPVLIAVHAPLGRTVHDLLVPAIPHGDVSTVMLLIVAIVGTTVAPWQLFFQQSYVIDKRLTTRFLHYERLDLAIGIGFVLFGAIAIVSFTAATFAAHREFGNFQDAAAVARGIATYAGRTPAVLFALALLDASLIGAAAVSLSTAYAVSDVLAFQHSLHRSVTQAPLFYAIYAGLIVLAAALVVLPGVPLGLLTNAVQALAGILLPSASVFLLLLCNDKAVLGPWTNTRRVNAFTGVVIAALITLSIILTASVIFPSIDSRTIVVILADGGLVALAAGAWTGLAHRDENGPQRLRNARWQMPPLESLPPLRLGRLERMWLIGLRVYLLLAVVMVVWRVALLSLAHAAL